MMTRSLWDWLHSWNQIIEILLTTGLLPCGFVVHGNRVDEVHPISGHSCTSKERSKWMNDALQTITYSQCAVNRAMTMMTLYVSSCINAIIAPLLCRNQTLSLFGTLSHYWTSCSRNSITARRATYLVQTQLSSFVGSTCTYSPVSLGWFIIQKRLKIQPSISYLTSLR